MSAKTTLLFAPLLMLLVGAGLAGAGAKVVPAELTWLQCTDETGAGGCTDGKALVDPHATVLSGDASRVFVAATGSDAVAVFSRDRSKGTLAQVTKGGPEFGCISEDGSGGDCLDGKALLEPMDLGATNDDRNVYVASFGSNAVDILTKDKDTRQFQQQSSTSGCWSEDGTGGACTDGRALTGASSIAINPAGGQNFVYVGGANSIAVLKRNLQSGLLTQLAGASGCVNDDGSDGCTDGYIPGTVVSMAFSSDGKSLYAAVSGGNGAILVFSRAPGGALTQLAGAAGCINDDGTDGCTDATAVVDPSGVALDRSRKNVYVASHGSGAVAIFARNQLTGALTQLAGTAGCISEDGTGGACTVGSTLADANRIVVASNNKSLQVTSDAGVATFVRTKSTGVLTQPAAPAGCVTETGSGGACKVGSGLDGAFGIVASDSKKHVYIAGSSDDSIVALQRS